MCLKSSKRFTLRRWTPRLAAPIATALMWCSGQLALAGEDVTASGAGAVDADTRVADADGAEPSAPNVQTSAAGTASPQAPAPVAAEEATPAPPVEPRELASLLTDASTDLGLVLEHPPVVRLATDECAFDETPPPPVGKVNVQGTLEFRAHKWWLRVSVVNDDSTTHSARVELSDLHYEVQAIRALALTVKSSAAPQPVAEKERVLPQAAVVDVSQGKATLATTGAALGGYFGFALESAGGDVDTRLVYPLVALGAGVGLASALIVAEEWPVDRASAWYISGGGVWLTMAGVLIASEQDLKHPTDRYPFGLIGTATGLGISTLVVSQRDVSEAEAVFSHSGAIFGAIAGGFVEELVDPASGKFPRLGVGMGTTGGWLLASLGTARFMPGLTSSRVLFADLGGFLGALVGAAAASPAVVNQGPPKPGDRRAFVGASLGGLALGSVVGYWLGGTADVPDSLPVSLRTTTLGPTMAATPFEPGLPSATALTLHSQW